MVTVIDMGMGNLQSVVNAFRRLGADIRITTQVEDLTSARAVVLPGVGAFGDGMASLRQKGLVEPLRRYALEEHRPLLGICLGMQLLAQEGEEHGRHQGLGVIRGRVVRLQPTHPGCRIPNMGWCDVTVTNRRSRLVGGIRDGEPFYFAHSYYLECAEAQDVAATIDYGQPIPAAVERGNVFGVQCHPEKSQDAGLDLLESFWRMIQASAVPEPVVS